MKIAIGADHRGFEKKQQLMQSIQDNKIEWVDAGCNSAERCDFPEYATQVAKQVQDGQVNAGILICGSGIGMSIAANRFKGVYAALAWNTDIARSSREHNNANILVLPGDYLSEEEMQKIIRVWVDTKFLGGKYQERIAMIDQL